MKFSKLFIRTSVPSAILIGIILSVTLGSFMGIAGIMRGIIYGIVGGALFGGFYSWFICEYANAPNRLLRNEFAKEYDIIYDGIAHYLSGKEAISGWLFLTSKGFFFKATYSNYKNYDMWIYLETIKSVSTYRSFNPFKKGLIFEINDGCVYKFVVFDAKTWISNIRRRKQL